jgi:hypothetical protein
MKVYQSEAAKLFHNEVREKKKAASGVHSKTGKNGYVGTMRFPSDIMSRKDKLRYRRSGKVMTTNMYEEIMAWDEFDKLETYEKKNRLQYWRNTYTNKEILETMGISNKRFYDMVADLDLPKAKRINSKDKPKRSAAAKAPKRSEEIAPPAPPAPVEIEKPVVQEVIVDGLYVVFNGTYKADQIQMKLNKFYALLDDEEDDFYIEMKIMQKAAQK